MRLERFRGPEVEAQLARALLAAARAAGVAIEVERHRSRPWASATFVGARHALTLAGEPAPALDGWVASLSEAELTLRGHVVVSVAVECIDDGAAVHRLLLSVLTIED
jgi:hypothetical protein